MKDLITLNKYNGKVIDICDSYTRYFLSMEDKIYQAEWMSKHPITRGHDRQNISFSFTSALDSTYLLYFSSDSSFNDPFIIETKEKFIDYVGIFIPGITYYWKVINKDTLDESEIDTFTTLDLYPRLISSGSVYNMRDLGGWSTGECECVKYGLLYRGAQLSLDNKWEKSYMNDLSHNVFDYLGIKTEVELRGGYDHKDSQISDKVTNIYINSVGYEQILDMNDQQKEQYKYLFEKLADRNNYPVYFHCSWGADRTGVLAFLLDGVLGVSYDNLCEDYELTSLSESGRRSRIDFPWKDMYPELIKRYGKKGKLFKDVIYDYLKDYIGVSQKQIDSFRRIMIEEHKPYNSFHKVSFRINNTVFLDVRLPDGSTIPNIDPYVSLDKLFNYWSLNGDIYDINKPVVSDLVLDANFVDALYEEYDHISIKDLGLGNTYSLKEARSFSYKPHEKSKGVIFSFDYEIVSNKNQFDDGVHVEIGELWDYKAHLWIQNLSQQHVYTKKDVFSISYNNELKLGNKYRIDVGVIIPKVGAYKGRKLFFFKINFKLISLYETNANLDLNLIGLAGTQGILHNIDL